MKKSFTLLALVMCLGVLAFGQAPEQINFQAVLRGDDGAVLENQSLSLVFSFYHESGGTAVYQETHNTSTDGFGLVQLRLGSGAPVIGSFQNVNWYGGSVFLRGEATLVSGGIITLAEQQLVSVPFALHSNTATALSGEDDVDNTNEIQELTLSGSTLTLTGSATQVNLAPYLGVNTDEQTLTFQNNILSITNGNSVNLNSLRDVADNDPQNELQTLALDNNALSISNGNTVDLTPLLNDADADPLNEIQDLTLTGSTLTISGSTSAINLAPFTGTNTDEQTLSLTDSILVISNGNAIDLSTIDNQTLQDVYTNGSQLILDGTHELSVTTNSGTSVLATNNGNLGIGKSDANQKLQVEGLTSLTTENQLDPLQTAFNTVFEAGALFNFTEKINGQYFNLGIASVLNATSQSSYAGMMLTKGPGQFNRGVYGVATGATVENTGVIGNGFGTSPGNRGVYGVATGGTNENTGVVGNAFGTSLINRGVIGGASGATNENSGLFGTASGASLNNRGVYGVAQSATNTNKGIFGAAYGSSQSNFGVDGQATGASINYGAKLIAYGGATVANYGVHATAYGGTTNFAGYFDGNVNVEGVLTVNGDSIDVNPSLHDAYKFGSSIVLDGTNEFAINTLEGRSVFATSNGNIGIGTTTPTATLDISSSDPDAAANLEISNSDNTHQMYFFPGRTSDPNPFIGVKDGDPLRIGYYDGSVFTERMRLGGTGNLGLGTASPHHKLHVQSTTSDVQVADLNILGIGTIEAGALYETNETNSAANSNAGLVSIARGTGQTNYAVLGLANNASERNRGVYGYARGGTIDNNGLYGNAAGASPLNIGVRGVSSGATVNYGLHGSTSASANFNVGLRGNATGATENIGGEGFATGTGNINWGIKGTSSGGSTSNYGGTFLAELAAPTNYGVHATATGATVNYGLYATASGGTTNYAGYFLGDVNVQGSLSVDGSILDTSVTLQDVYDNGNQITLNATDELRIQSVEGQSIVAKPNGNLGISGAIELGEILISNYGGDNFSIGQYSMTAISGGTGGGNIAVGHAALEGLANGSYNIALGYRAMDDATGGSNNIGLGYFTLNNLQEGVDNVAIGRYAGLALDGTVDNQNVMIGAESDIADGITVERAVALGYRAKAGQSDAIVLGNHTNSNVRVGIGTNTPGEKLHVVGNVSIEGNMTVSGTANLVYSNTTSGLTATTIQAAIDELSLEKPNNLQDVINNNSVVDLSETSVIFYEDGQPVLSTGLGNVGIGVINPSAQLHVAGNTLMDGGLDVFGPITATTFNGEILGSSDARLKTDIKQIENATEILSQIDGKSYYWKKDEPASAVRQYGVIAQELEKILPDLVKTDKDGMKAVNYISLIPFLIEALKSQQQEIAALKTQNEELSSSVEKQLKELTALVMEMKSDNGKQAATETSEKE